MKIPKPPNLQDLRRRAVIVPGWATKFQVVQHVVRIDIDEPGKAGTHGWQVRHKKTSKLFSDSTKRNRRSPSASPAEAVSYLSEIYSGPTIRLRNSPTKRKKNDIQEAGIRLVTHRRKHKTFEEFYVAAVSPIKGEASKRVYVGTENTITLPRIDAMQKARLLRKEMEKTFLKNLGCK